MKGNNNPDGRLICNNDDVILWDNKSCETDYNFPDKHFNQFKRYIIEEKSYFVFDYCPIFFIGLFDESSKIKSII